METPQNSDDLIIELLTEQHNVRKLRTGESQIDGYLRSHANKNSVYGFGRTYVAIKPGHPRVWAYYTLAANHIDVSAYPSSDGCPQKISIALLGRIGVDKNIQNIGIGRKLMGHALQNVLDASEKIGIHAIVLDAKNQGLVSYYAKFGFEKLMDSPLHLYLSISSLAQA